MMRTGKKNNWSGANYGNRCPPSDFKPAPDCEHCNSGMTVLVTPKHFPVEVVALVCFKCGRVKEYREGLLFFTPLEAMRERSGRQHFVKRRVAVESKQPKDYETARQKIIMGFEMGVPAKDIATELGMMEMEILVIAKREGVLEKENQDAGERTGSDERNQHFH